MAPDASMIAEARTSMSDQLKAVGFAEVTMLSKPAQPSMPPSPVREWWLPEAVLGFGLERIASVSGEACFAAFAPCEKTFDLTRHLVRLMPDIADAATLPRRMKLS